LQRGLPLWKSGAAEWLYVAVLVAAGAEAMLAFIEPALRSIAFFRATFIEIFSATSAPPISWGSIDGRLVVLVYYCVWADRLQYIRRGALVARIRAPRQELALAARLVVHGICWSLFHLFIQPTFGTRLEWRSPGWRFFASPANTEHVAGDHRSRAGNTPLLLRIASGVT